MKPVRQSHLYDAIVTLMGTPERVKPEAAQMVTRHSIREKRAASRARVLVAEDNPVNQKVAAKMLDLESLNKEFDHVRAELFALVD